MVTENANSIEYIEGGTYKILAQLQTAILSNLSIEDTEKLRKGQKLSLEGQDILRQEKAVRMNSNSISVLGSKLAGLNSMELKSRVLDFIEKGPSEYKELRNEVINYKKVNDFLSLKDILEGKTNERYVNLLADYAMEVQNISNQIGFKLEALNEFLLEYGINKQFELKKFKKEKKGEKVINFDCSNISNIVMNHVDSNIDEVVRNFLVLQKDYTINRNLGNPSKGDLLNISNKNYRKEMEGLVEAFKKMDNADEHVKLAVILDKEETIEKCTKNYEKAVSNLREYIVNMSEPVYDLLAKIIEDKRLDEVINTLSENLNQIKENNLDNKNDLEL